MRKILWKMSSLILLCSGHLFASFEVAITPKLSLEYFMPSSLKYQMNIPGTEGYIGSSSPLGSFLEIKDGKPTKLYGGPKHIFKAKGFIDLILNWKGDHDTRNQILLNAKINGLYTPYDLSGSKLTALPDINSDLWRDIDFNVFYQGFFLESDFFIKFGKYLADTPFNWGGEINSAQLELGYKNDEQAYVSFDVSLYGWGYVPSAWYNNKGEIVYNEPVDTKGDPESGYVHTQIPEEYDIDLFPAVASSTFNLNNFKDSLKRSYLGTNINVRVPVYTDIFDTFEIVFKTPFFFPIKQLEDPFNNFRWFPIINIFLDNENFYNQSTLALSLRRAFSQKANSTLTGFSVSGRQEVGFKYKENFVTSGLMSFMTGSGTNNSYSFTALNFKNPMSIHYGEYIPYLYEEVIPFTGHYSLGISQQYHYNNILLRMGVGSFWALDAASISHLYYQNSGSHIGMSYSLGMDWRGVLGEGSLFKIESIIFQPTQISTFRGGYDKYQLSEGYKVQSRNLFFGFKIMIEHIFH